MSRLAGPVSTLSPVAAAQMALIMDGVGRSLARNPVAPASIMAAADCSSANDVRARMCRSGAAWCRARVVAGPSVSGMLMSTRATWALSVGRAAMAR